MKKSSVLVIATALLLSSCGMVARYASSDSGQKFQDGIYNSTPDFTSKADKAVSKAETDALVEKTKASRIYLFGEKKDTVMIPENMSARIQYDKELGSTVVTVGENPYDWQNNINPWSYYTPYSIGSSWYWSRHYSPWYWDAWSYNPWYYRYGGWYGGWYDPWYYGYGGWYDPWYYGYAGWYGGWYDPWYGYMYPHYCGWYGGWDPYWGHHHHGPIYIAPDMTYGVVLADIPVQTECSQAGCRPEEVQPEAARPEAEGLSLHHHRQQAERPQSEWRPAPHPGHLQSGPPRLR